MTKVPGNSPRRQQIKVPVWRNIFGQPVYPGSLVRTRTGKLVPMRSKEGQVELNLRRLERRGQ